jgi:hypothetical protein
MLIDIRVGHDAQTKRDGLIENRSVSVFPLLQGQLLRILQTRYRIARRQDHRCRYDRPR